MACGKAAFPSLLGGKVLTRIAVSLFAILAVGACVTLAPGADQVRVTDNAADVTACKAVGNIQVPKNADGTVDIANAQRQLRNQVVGFSGNVALVTEGLVGVPGAGVAYLCP
jgi:hypothetical protein